ncbi:MULTISPECIES: hypothetical protein [Pseudomonas]|uniref:Uncharacterized protein n=1 Tax=Pseudomonas gingeri TaxID=117681 RepID=A0A7Y7W998_9PSED|nr:MULTISPECIES: hypothetical protein [Pseudomonas]MCU1737575.1 hypothetical protein [Pseudomonas sp. 20S_6.2_Bac1]NWB44916.1 hypothetical protein [Pseudomonas gingeri]
MSMDIINMYDRMPSFWNERMEVTIGDLAKPAAVDPNFNRVRDLQVFWRGEAEIDSERGQPPAVNAPFYSFDYHGWSAKIAKLSENVQRDLMEIQALLDLISDDAQPQPRGLIGDEGLGREVFDRLEGEVDEVVSGMPECKVEFSGPHDCNHTARSESALAAKQLDAYSELTDSDFGWRIDDALLPSILDMVA